VSVAVLNSSTGINKSQYLNVATPFHQWIHNANVGILCAARSTLPATNSKWHAEFRIDGFNASGKWQCGICDSGSVTSFATSNGNPPGLSSVPGLTVSVNLGSTSLLIYRAATQTNSVTIPALAVNDIIILEGDTSTKVIKFYVYDASAVAMANSGAAVATVTLASPYIPAAWYLFGGGQRGSGLVGNSDAGTANLGGSSFVMTPTSGYDFFA
jgi:hypothetical protein